MTYIVELLPTTLEEMEKSYEWYERRQNGLGERFIKYVNNRISEIADHPKRYAIKKKNLRETLVEVFPFIIMYEVLDNEEKVLIVHVFHAKRNPRLKYKKT